MTVSVHLARADEKDRCVALLAILNDEINEQPGEAIDRNFALLIEGERGAIAVAEEDGELLGLAVVSYNLGMRYPGGYCQLEELVVDPAARGKNVGGLLVEATIACAKERNCAEIGAYLVATTEHNRPFYEKFGFEAVGTEMRQVLD